jgi:hypothetical protein
MLCDAGRIFRNGSKKQMGKTEYASETHKFGFIILGVLVGR